MLLEVNRVRHLILDRPPRDQAERWCRICALTKSGVIVPPGEVSSWKQNLPDDAIVVGFRDSYATEVAGNIRDVLIALDAQPHNTLYVGFDARDIAEATSTRIGTALVDKGMGQKLPDLFFAPSDVDDLETAITDLVNGRSHGHIMEVFSTRYGGGGSSGGTGYVNFQHYLRGRDHLNSKVADDLEIVVAGRYFPDIESRHVKHQPSLRLLHAKNGDRRGGPLVSAFGDVLTLTLQHCPSIDLITRIPPKPSTAHDNLGKLVYDAVKAAKQRREADLEALVDLDAIFCRRDYDEQKRAGHYGRRAENVRRAFAARAESVAGATVLLVDDILTSGATMVEAAGTLLEAGAESVIACPLAITQSVIKYDEEYELPCPGSACDGIMRIRFARNSDGAFWGCTNWRPEGRGCSEMMTFDDGLRAANRLTCRDNVVVLESWTF